MLVDLNEKSDLRSVNMGFFENFQLRTLKQVQAELNKTSLTSNNRKIIAPKHLAKPIEALLKNYVDIFAHAKGEVGRIQHSLCRLNLINETPITLRPYKCSDQNQERIDKIIDGLIEKDLIEKSLSQFWQR